MATEPSANELGIEVTLTLSDMKKVLSDAKIKDLVEQCGEAAPGDVGSCVEGALLERLTEMFSEGPGGEPDEVPLAPVSMAEWIEKDPSPDSEESCRPCALPVTVQWYSEELKAQGRADLAKGLEEVSLSATPLTAAKELDRIKQVVGAELQGRLVEFDATTQANA